MRKPRIRFSVGHNTPENHELAETLASIDGVTLIDIFGNDEIWLTVKGKVFRFRKIDVL